MPRKVLTRLTASAPPSAAAPAIATMSVTFGVSLAITGKRADLADPTHQAADRASASIPRSSPWLTFGHETLSSTAARPGSSPSISAICDELVLVLARDVGDHRRADGAEVRQVVRPEVLDAVVVEADRVQEPRGGLDGARGRIARPRPEGHGLGDHPPEPLQPHEPGHLADVAERARGDQDRVLQIETTEPHL